MEDKQEIQAQQTVEPGRKKRGFRLLVLTMAMATMLAGFASASEGGGGGSMSSIVAATSDVTSLFTSLFGLMTANPLLTFFLAVSVLGAVIGLFKKSKGAAKG